MVNGAHLLLFSGDPDADRAFLRDILGFPYVDTGHNWLIFRLPPSELGVHPIEGDQQEACGMMSTSLFLMCEDLNATIAELNGKGVPAGEVTEEPWGLVTTITLPSGGLVGLYQPKHLTALHL